jgi:hypothetical protein
MKEIFWPPPPLSSTPKYEYERYERVLKIQIKIRNLYIVPILSDVLKDKIRNLKRCLRASTVASLKQFFGYFGEAI